MGYFVENPPTYCEECGTELEPLVRHRNGFTEYVYMTCPKVKRLGFFSNGDHTNILVDMQIKQGKYDPYTGVKL